MRRCARTRAAGGPPRLCAEDFDVALDADLPVRCSENEEAP